ncbi:hypothetical protein GLOIN_2v1514455 [Rhizophagus irregularis DAOM 181602=DAOM 197198]|nr:hypothetical protein GLOIN_2v1514455 [Rhizophagus irregularis DAOM 181602=DAOM 197198]
MVAWRFFTDSRSGYGAGWVTYSIVDFTHFEIYLGGVAVVIYIERVGFLILAFLICNFGRLFVLCFSISSALVVVLFRSLCVSLKSLRH